jgi:hypothetical protein
MLKRLGGWRESREESRRTFACLYGKRRFAEMRRAAYMMVYK